MIFCYGGVNLEWSSIADIDWLTYFELLECNLGRRLWWELKRSLYCFLSTETGNLLWCLWWRRIRNACGGMWMCWAGRRVSYLSPAIFLGELQAWTLEEVLQHKSCVEWKSFDEISTFHENAREQKLKKHEGRAAESHRFRAKVLRFYTQDTVLIW